MVWLSLPFSQRLESTASNLGQCSPRLTSRDGAIEVNWEVEIRSKVATERPRRDDRSMLAPAWPKRDQRDHVNGADSRMNAAADATLLLCGQIDRCDRNSRQRTSHKAQRVGISYVGVDATVVILVVVHVEQLHSRSACDDRRVGGEDRRIAPLTHIRDYFV